MKAPTLQTIPLDIILHIGTFLRTMDHCSSLTDINKLTLAAVLEDKDMLEHLLERYPHKKEITHDVALSGNLRVLKWTIKKINCLISDHDGWTFRAAVEVGNLEMVKYLHKLNWPMNDEVCHAAARGGHLLILKYLRESDCRWDGSICEGAIEGGHLHVLEYLKEIDCFWDECTCYAAAKGGHLDVLKYLRELGCPWDEDTCWYAARYGHAYVLRWAIDNGCPEPMFMVDHDNWYYNGYIKMKNALLGET